MVSSGAHGDHHIRRPDRAVVVRCFALHGRLIAPEPAIAPGHANISIEVTGADIHRLLGDLAGIDTAQGRANVTMSLNSNGRSSFELVSALAGNALINEINPAAKIILNCFIDSSLMAGRSPCDRSGCGPLHFSRAFFAKRTGR